MWDSILGDYGELLKVSTDLSSSPLRFKRQWLQLFTWFGREFHHMVHDGLYFLDGTVIPKRVRENVSQYFNDFNELIPQRWEKHEH